MTKKQSGCFLLEHSVTVILWRFDCPVFSWSCAQVVPLDRLSRFESQMTCFCARRCLLDVGNMPQNSLKVDPTRQIQAKTRKSKNRTSPKLQIRSSQNLRTWQQPLTTILWWSTITPQQIQHGWRPPSWKSLWRHNLSRMVQFGRNMASRRRITSRWRQNVKMETGSGISVWRPFVFRNRK